MPFFNLPTVPMAAYSQHPTQRLIEWRFSVRTLFIAVTAVCLILATFQVFGLQQAMETLFSLSSISLLIGSIWLASRDSVRALGIVLVFHFCVGAFLAIGPIAARVLDDRVNLPVTRSAANAPILQRALDTNNSLDYEPGIRFIRNNSLLRGLFRLVGVLTVALFVVPPTAPIVAAAVPILLLRLYPVLTERQLWCGWGFWVFGLLPMLYLIFCEAVIERWLGL